MNMLTYQNELNLSSSPHARDRWSTAFIMRMVVLSLLPATVVGVIVNGLHALLIVLCAVAAAVLSEFAFDKIAHKPDTWKDGSAVVTGLMLALSLSPSVPVTMPIIGSVFAIIVVKCCFGGLGKNFLNPALAARCFLLISFSATMSTYQIVDGVTSATPMALLKSGETVNITSLFLGTANGVIGGSALALLVGGLLLWVMDIIHGQICFSVLGAFTLCMGLFGGQGFDPMFLLTHLLGGGVIMGAFFMATDYATSPVGKLGQTVYGVLIGALGALFRIKGSAPDSFSYSVISANLFVPLIDMYIIPKPFAFRKGISHEYQEEKPLVKRIPKPVVVLCVITLIAGLALSGVYSMTKDTIEDQKRAASAASYRVVVPDADHFDVDEALDKAVSDLGGNVYGTGYGRVKINEAFVGKTADDEVAGYAVSVTSSDGFDGNITLAVGIQPDGTVNGISFTELHETPGMGMRVDEDAFKGQFSGKNVGAFTLNKAGGSTEDDQIDTVSGASTTSGAVVNAVNAALDFFRTNVKGGNA